MVEWGASAGGRGGGAPAPVGPPALPPPPLPPPPTTPPTHPPQTGEGDLSYGAMLLLVVSTAGLEVAAGEDGLLTGAVPSLALLALLRVRASGWVGGWGWVGEGEGGQRVPPPPKHTPTRSAAPLHPPSTPPPPHPQHLMVWQHCFLLPMWVMVVFRFFLII